jgi:hypothetical protein
MRAAAKANEQSKSKTLTQTVQALTEKRWKKDDKRGTVRGKPHPQRGKPVIYIGNNA